MYLINEKKKEGKSDVHLSSDLLACMYVCVRNRRPAFRIYQMNI